MPTGIVGALLAGAESPNHGVCNSVGAVGTHCVQYDITFFAGLGLFALGLILVLGGVLARVLEGHEPPLPPGWYPVKGGVGVDIDRYWDGEVWGETRVRPR